MEQKDLTKLKEIVLFPFDNYNIPFRHGLQLELIKAKRYEGNPILSSGVPGSADSSTIAYYGTVIEIYDKLYIWYLGKGDSKDSELRVCYAVSHDGFYWEKPNLNLVEYNGNKNNNLVYIDWNWKVMSCSVIYEPEEPDKNRVFKMFCEIESHNIRNQGCVVFSPDGIHWNQSRFNPVTHIRIEPTGLIKRNSCYYVVGQNAGTDRAFQKRVLIVIASYDFEHWTDAVVMGFRRDDLPPRPVLLDYQMGKQVHLGAGLWDRGNTIIGLYGQWNARLDTGDRREMRMDIGLLISNDAMHYYEPIPDFKIIDTSEEGWSASNPQGDPPRFAQGQGIVNIGDKTITYYSIWGKGSDNSIRAAYWKRDRLGYFSPNKTPIEGQTWIDEVKPHFISAPINVGQKGSQVFINASGLSEHSRITVEILNERFEKIEGYASSDCIPLKEGSGIRILVRWKYSDIIYPKYGPIRVRVNWDGLRLEDAKVYAVYIVNIDA